VTQDLAHEVIALEGRLAELRARMDRADARTQAAWARVFALFGGDTDRYDRFVDKHGI
jgi:hypothetical protein